MRIKEIRGVWDNRNRPNSTFGFDQDFISVKVDGELIQEYNCYRLLHKETVGGDNYYFYVRPYLDGNLVSFVHHGEDISKPEGGFGGSIFKYGMVDGSIHEVNSPWSSGDYHYNEVVTSDKHVIEGSVIEPGRFSGFVSNIAISKTLEMIKEQKLPYSLVLGLSTGPFAYEIVHNDDVQQFVEYAGIHPIWRDNPNRPQLTRWSGQRPETMHLVSERAQVLVP